MTATSPAPPAVEPGLDVRTPPFTILRDAGLPAPRGDAVRFLEGNLPPFLRPGERDLFAACAAGVHPARNDDPAWMGREAVFLPGHDPAAGAVGVDLWVPPELVRRAPAGVHLRLAGVDLGRAEVREGRQRVEVNLPAEVRALPPGSPLVLRLSWDRTFRPADEGTSGDVRELSAILVGAGLVDDRGYPLPDVPRPAPEGGLSRVTPALHGTCTVCGSTGGFFRTPGLPVTEDFRCPACGSFARWRMLARGLLLFLAGRGWAATSVASLRDGPRGEPVRILDTCSSWPPAGLLRGVPGIDLFVAEYDPDTPPGAPLGPGVRCEDLERLSFPAASLDLVLAGDVLEHVRLYRRALAEIFRVLRPGGEFLFTVPFIEGDPAAREHVVFREVTDPENPARDRDLREPTYHEDTRGGGSLVYRIYARDLLLEELRRQGFVVAFERRTVPGLALPDQALFRAVKPGVPGPGGRT